MKCMICIDESAAESKSLMDILLKYVEHPSTALHSKDTQMEVDPLADSPGKPESTFDLIKYLKNEAGIHMFVAHFVKQYSSKQL